MVKGASHLPIILLRNSKTPYGLSWSGLCCCSMRWLTAAAVVIRFSYVTLFDWSYRPNQQKTAICPYFHQRIENWNWNQKSAPKAIYRYCGNDRFSSKLGHDNMKWSSSLKLNPQFTAVCRKSRSHQKSKYKSLSYDLPVRACHTSCSYHDPLLHRISTFETLIFWYFDPVAWFSFWNVLFSP